MRNWTAQRCFKVSKNKLIPWLVALTLSSCGKKIALEPGEREDAFEESTSSNAVTEPFSPSLLATSSIPGNVWSQPGYNNQHLMGPFALSPHLSLRHKVKASGHYTVPISPVANTKYVFVLTKQGTVAAFSMRGEKKWETSIMQRDIKYQDIKDLSGGLACNEQNVYVTTPQKQTLALDSFSGKILWTHNTHAPARNGPCLTSKHLIVTTNDGCTHLSDIKTGKKLWEYINDLSENTSLIYSAAPAVDQDHIIAATNAGEVMSIDAQQGSLLWVQNVSSEPKENSIVHIAALPVVKNDRIYTLSYNGQMTCCHRHNGRILWTQKVKSYHTPVISGKVIFVVTEDNRLQAFNVHNGAQYWDIPLPKKLGNASAPLYAGNRIYITGSGGYMMALDPKNQGAVLQEWHLKEPCTTAPIIVKNQLIVLSDQGSLFFFGPKKT